MDIGLNRDCRKIRKAINSASFQEKMTELIDNTAGNNEKGYWGKYNNDDILQFSENDFFESAEGEFEMEPSTPQDPIDSYNIIILMVLNRTNNRLIHCQYFLEQIYIRFTG